jgi:hypothetical protein
MLRGDFRKATAASATDAAVLFRWSAAGLLQAVGEVLESGDEAQAGETSKYRARWSVGGLGVDVGVGVAAGTMGVALGSVQLG